MERIRSRTIKSLEDSLCRKLGFEPPQPDIRRKLVDTLHARPGGLIAGAAFGVATGVVTISSTRQPDLIFIAAVLAILAASRIASALGAKHLTGRLGAFCQRTYWVGALSYAGAAGLTAAIALLKAEDTHVVVLTVGFALVFGAGIAIGNAGRPVVALGQMGLTSLPIMVACFIIATPALITLALILPSLTIGLTYITMNIFASLSSQVAAATQSAALASQMRDQARQDSITGLANRVGFEAAANDLIASRPMDLQGERQLALLWLDLHRFKEVNDMLGHEMGDRVLRAISERLRARTPKGAVIARFGSDEFLLLAEMPTRRDVEELAGMLSADLAMPLRIAGHRIESGASIGVSIMDKTSTNLDRMMQHADLALYHAKAAGRHQISYFNTAMTRNLVRKKEIEAELRAAVQKDELSIYFQPIIDLGTGRIRAFEALVRWFHPERGELVPDEFIPVAEETGLIITLGNWITHQAARACANWPDDVMVCVNLSPMQIHAPGAALGILNALNAAGLDPSRLELEVTESLFLDDNEATAQFIEQLSAEGVRFALDDFGTGYSSLHYINKFPFSTIKVDRSFVSGPKTGRHTHAIIRAVAELGATLGMDIVAEGLETLEQVDSVREAGCTLGQGYHFSRAVPEHLAVQLITDERRGQVQRMKLSA